MANPILLCIPENPLASVGNLPIIGKSPREARGNLHIIGKFPILPKI